MKTLSRITGTTLLFCIAIPAFSQVSNTYVYLRSNANQPWGQSTNEDAMDNVLGQGEWTTMYFETVVASDLFGSHTTGNVVTLNTSFIFMEGGDTSFNAFKTFITTNNSAAYTWVHNGGRLLLMSAPNDPVHNDSVTLFDQIVLNSDDYYGSAATEGNATDITTSIFTNSEYHFTGDFFAHGYFTGFAVKKIMLNNIAGTDGQNETILGQEKIGTGLFVFGAMTTDNFHLPQPDAHNLLENIIGYTINAH